MHINFGEPRLKLLSSNAHTQVQTIAPHSSHIHPEVRQGSFIFNTMHSHTFTLKMQGGVFLIQTLLYLLLNLCLWGQITRFRLSVNITAHSVSSVCSTSSLIHLAFRVSYKYLKPDYLKISILWKIFED